MKLKMKLLPVTLAVFLLAVPCLTARASDDMNDMVGMVVSNSGGTLNMVSEQEDGYDLEWSCLVSEANVFDLLTGLSVYPEEISEGMLIRVFKDSPDKASIVWINCWEDGAAAFKATVSENIQHDGNECYFLTGDEKYRVTLTRDTVIYDPDCGYISPDGIRPGDEMFVWVDMVTASYPSQAYPGQVVLIR